MLQCVNYSRGVDEISVDIRKVIITTAVLPEATLRCNK